MSKRKCLEDISFDKLTVEDNFVHLYCYTEEYSKLSHNIKEELKSIEEAMNIAIEGVLQRNNYYKKKRT